MRAHGKGARDEVTEVRKCWSHRFASNNENFVFVFYSGGKGVPLESFEQRSDINWLRYDIIPWLLSKEQNVLTCIRAYKTAIILKNLYWGIFDLQCCAIFRCTARWLLYVNIYWLFFWILFLCRPNISLVAQMVKCLPMMQETWVRSLGREDALEKEMATHSSILASKIPQTEEPSRLQSMGSQRVGHDWATSLHFTFTFTYIGHYRILGRVPYAIQ